jgi:hypothetical protein
MKRRNRNLLVALILSGLLLVIGSLVMLWMDPGTEIYTFNFGGLIIAVLSIPVAFHALHNWAADYFCERERRIADEVAENYEKYGFPSESEKVIEKTRYGNTMRDSTSMQILKIRYAKGEISEKEYEDLKNKLNE